MIGLAEKRGNPKELCTMRARLAGPYMMKGHYTQALALLEACLTEASGLGVVSDWMLIMVYDEGADVMVVRHPEALTVATAAYHQCVERAHTMQANCALAVARAYRAQGQSDAAIRWAKTSISGAKAMLARLRATLILGLLHCDLHQWEDAQKYNDLAQPILNAMGATPQALSLAGHGARCTAEPVNSLNGLIEWRPRHLRDSCHQIRQSLDRQDQFGCVRTAIAYCCRHT